MEKILTISAALRSEKIRDATKNHQCESFIKLAICVENLNNLSAHNDFVAFECDEYGVVEEHSSKGWSKVFTLKKRGNFEIISIPRKYIMSNVIPDFQ